MLLRLLFPLPSANQSAETTMEGGAMEISHRSVTYPGAGDTILGLGQPSGWAPAPAADCRGPKQTLYPIPSRYNFSNSAELSECCRTPYAGPLTISHSRGPWVWRTAVGLRKATPAAVGCSHGRRPGRPLPRRVAAGISQVSLGSCGPGRATRDP